MPALGRRGLGPIFVAVLVCALLVLAWRAFQDKLPESPWPETYRGELIWAENGAGPFYCLADLEQTDLIFAGDSRMRRAIVTDTFERAGMGSPAVLWGGAAQTADLLEMLPNYPARRVVLSLAPLSIYRPSSLLSAELLRLAPPEFSRSNFRQELVDYGLRMRAYLLEQGHPTAGVDVFVGNWIDRLRRDLVRLEPTTENIDLNLGEWLETRRRRVLRTIGTHSWESSWFPPLDEHRSDADYLATHGPQTVATRRERLAEVGAQISRLVADGWEIVCIRLPVSDSLYEIEEAGLPAVELAAMCKQAGVAFLDYSRDPELKTSDGTHLTEQSGRKLSRRLVDELRRVSPWPILDD